MNVTVFGTELIKSASARCKFGSAAPAPLTVTSSTSGYCICPPYPTASVVPLQISINGRNYTSGQVTFSYYSIVNASMPSGLRGPTTGGTPVTVSLVLAGDLRSAVGFTLKLTDGVSTLSVPVQPPTGSGATSLVFFTPSVNSLVPVNFTLSCSYGPLAALSVPVSSPFEFYPPPTIISVVPVGIPADLAGVQITLQGINLFDRPLSFLRVVAESSPGGPVIVDAPTVRDSVSVTKVVRFSAALSGATASGRTIIELSLNNKLQFTGNGVRLSIFVVTAVAPGGGPVSGGTTVVVTGAGFMQTAVCRFGEVDGLSSTFLSSTRLLCTAPPVTGASSVSVRTSLDAVTYSPAAPPASFVYYPAPVITAVFPFSGPASLNSSSAVTLVGSGFDALRGTVPWCMFQGSARSQVTSYTNTTATCPIPISSGVHEVSLALNGVDFEQGPSFYFFALKGASPMSGPVTGGTMVSVMGRGFPEPEGGDSPLRCVFGGQTVASTIIDSSSLRCVTPVSAVNGTVRFGISADGGATAALNAQVLFTFFAVPVISAISPPCGPAGARVPIVLTLEGLFPSSPRASDPVLCLLVASNGAVERITATSVSERSMTCQIPPNLQTGVYSVNATFNGVLQDAVGATSALELFSGTVSVSPALGPVTGQTPLTVTGTGFSRACTSLSCTFSISSSPSSSNGNDDQGANTTSTTTTVLLSAAAVVSPTQVLCSVPDLAALRLDPGSINVTLTSNNVSHTAAVPFQLYPVPVITAVSPKQVSSAGGPVVIYGSNLPGWAKCVIGGAVVPTAAADPLGGALNCTLPLQTRTSNLTVAVTLNSLADVHLALPNVTITVNTCPPGFSFTTETSLCLPCEPGTFSDLPQSPACRKCPESHYADEWQMSACKVCPENTITRDKAINITACWCDKDFYRADNLTGLPCLPCPPGGTCAGGREIAVPARGYWAAADNPLQFVKCDTNERACLGGGTDRCATGFSGRMCSQCAPDYFKLESDCKRCPRFAQGILIAFVLFAFLISILLVKAGRRARPYGGTIGIATKFFQILAVINRLEIAWPRSVKDTIRYATSPFMPRADIVAPECSVPSVKYGLKWGMIMFLPGFFVGIFAVLFAFAYAKARYRGVALKRSFLNRFINAFVSLVSLGYLTLASTAIEPFGCRLASDHKYTLLADTSRLCFDPAWYKLLPFFLLGFVVYVVALPVALFVWLRRNRDRLTDPDVVERYGGLYSSYVPSLSHWEPLVLLEKIAVATTGLLLSGFVMFQIILLQVIFVVTMSVYQAKAPYIRGKDNRLHMVLRWASLCVLFAGVIFKASQFPSPWMKRMVEVIAILFLVGGIVFVAVNVLWNVWQIHVSQKASISEELTRTLVVMSPQGRLLVTRWLALTGPGWQPVFQGVMANVLRLCNIVKPPRREIGAPKVPREGEYADVPEIRSDPESDMIVAVFCSGLLRDDLVPIVRTWVEEQAERAPDALSAFARCFLALAHDSMMEQRGRGGSSTSSSRTARNAVARLRRGYEKLFRGRKQTVTLEMTAAGKERPCLALLRHLYGREKAQAADPTRLRDPDFVLAFHAYYLSCTDRPADPSTRPSDSAAVILRESAGVALGQEKRRSAKPRPVSLPQQQQQQQQARPKSLPPPTGATTTTSAAKAATPTNSDHAIDIEMVDMDMANVDLGMEDLGDLTSALPEPLFISRSGK